MCLVPVDVRGGHHMARVLSVQALSVFLIIVHLFFLKYDLVKILSINIMLRFIIAYIFNHQHCFLGLFSVCECLACVCVCTDNTCVPDAFRL